MGNPVTVKGATIALQASPPLSITTTTHSASQAPSASFVSSEGNEILLQSDLESSLQSYTTNYTTTTFPTPGMLMFQSLVSISGLSTLVKKAGDPIVTQGTTGTIICSVSAPASNQAPATDVVPTYTLDFSISDAGQTVTTSD